MNRRILYLFYSACLCVSPGQKKTNKKPFSIRRDQPKDDAAGRCSASGGSLHPHPKCIFCGATLTLKSTQKTQNLPNNKTDSQVQSKKKETTPL